MSEKTSSIYQFQIKWQERFHEECKGWVKTRESFRQNIIVDYRHIENAGLEKDLARLQIEEEIIASLILHGKLDVARAENQVEVDTKKLRLVIGGVLKGLEWTEKIEKKEIKHKEDRAAYVVLQEKKKKSGAKVVTCYTAYYKEFDSKNHGDLPEVPYDIWID